MTILLCFIDFAELACVKEAAPGPFDYDYIGPLEALVTLLIGKLGEEQWIPSGELT